MDEFAGKVDLLGVYITEAHAQDEWPISSARFTPDKCAVILNQPKTTEERVEVAKSFIKAFNFRVPMLVDPISNPFDEIFAPWPLRFYIVQNRILVYKSQPKNCSYDVAELRNRILSVI